MSRFEFLNAVGACRVGYKKIFTNLFAAIILFSLLPSSVFAQNPNLYRNKTHAFRITFPDGWVQKSGYGPNIAVKSVNERGETIAILVRKLPGAETFDDYSEKELRDFTKEMFDEFKNNFNDAILLGSGVTHISNKKAIWFMTSYSGKHIGGEIRIKVLQVMTLHKGKYFNISCGSTPERFSEFEGIFLRTLNSFYFEDPSWY